MSLAGKNIVVTRALNQSAELIRLLMSKNAQPLSYPCIEIRYLSHTLTPTLSQHAWRGSQATMPSGMTEFDWIIFTSKNAVTNNFTAHKIATVGQKTAQYAESILQRPVDVVPSTFTALSIQEYLGDVQGKKILLPQGNLAKNDLRISLENAGAIVTTVEMYETVRGKGGVDVPAFIKTNPLHAITFTSGSCARFFKERWLDEGGSFNDLAQTHIACIGEPTAYEAASLGFSIHVIAHTHTAAGLVDALEKFYQEPL